MRKTALFAGVFAAAVIFLAEATPAKAMSLDNNASAPASIAELTTINNTKEAPEASDSVTQKEKPEEQNTAAQAEPTPQSVTHTVVKGDSLSKIAKAHETTWQRLFNKNVQLSHPDVINPNDVIAIPRPDEVLADRPIPTATPQPAPQPEARPVNRQSKPAAAKKSAPKPSTRIDRGSSSGNRYVRGYCTWYAKNRRADLPNTLGNANTWVARARAQGIPTGSAPRVGAIGQQGMHVVYVEQVHGNGTVTVSEMNFKGLGVISSRTVPASNFQYIY